MDDNTFEQIIPSIINFGVNKLKDYNLGDYCGDAFKDLWYGILEDNALGIEVDFINLYDKEYIFSTKNLKKFEQIDKNVGVRPQEEVERLAELVTRI